MIVGNQKEQKLLKKILEQERGTILVFGPEGVGKYSFLESIIKNERGEKIILSNENKFFSLETAKLLTSLGRQKKERLIVLVNDAHKFSNQAQNIFLKTIEEELTPTVFIFVTNQLTKILPTIRSRSFLVKFSLVPVKETENFLRNKGYSDFEIKTALFFYPHQPGKALNLLTEKNKLNLLSKFVNLPVEERLLLIEEIKKIFKPKEFLELYLIILKNSFKEFSFSEVIKIKEIYNLYVDLDYNLNSDVHLADLILNYG
jgi:replication-associated recombination protein RarA